MIECNGNIFDFLGKEFICITTNGYVKHNGELTMGAGIARIVNDKLPGISYGLGQAVNKYGNIPLVNLDLKIITVPTKNHWSENADIELITKSLKILVEIVSTLKIEKVYLPRPGCGNGKLDWSDIKLICECYLDNRFFIINKTLKSPI